MELEDYPGLRMAVDTAVPTPANKETKQMADNIPVEQTEAYKAGLAAGEAKAGDRMKAVFASEHFAGREAAAAKYLGTDMTAEQITTVLADLPAAPKIDQAAVTAAAEEAARAAMQENLQGRGNADLGADTGASEPKTGRVAADAVWSDARAYVDRNTHKEG